MALFSQGSEGYNGQTRNGKGLDYVNEAGTGELRQFVQNNIISESRDIDRIMRYQLYWNFYKGQHWRMYNDTFLKFNYCKAFVNKVLNFTLGKNGFGLTVEALDLSPIDPEVEAAAEAIITTAWTKNKKRLRQYEAMQMGSVAGDLWVLAQWKADDFGTKYIDYKVLDSRHAFPIFENGNYDALTGFMIRSPLGENDENYKLFCMKFTSTKIETWYQKDTIAKEDRLRKFQPNSYENIYGFIPVVHFKNKPDSTGYFSESDLVDILGLNKKYNELGQTIDNIIQYYVEPTTVVTGGTVKSITKGLGRIWSGLPAEANVFNLGLGEDLNGAMTFMQTIKTNMHEIGDMPENALGKLQAISNTSAAALEMTYQPLVQLADNKATCYEEGFSKLHSLTIRMLRVVDAENPLLKKLPVDFEDRFIVRPEWKYGLPDDEAALVNQADAEIRIGLDTKKNWMNRLGKRNAPLLIQEVLEEKIEDMQLNAVGQAFLNELPDTENIDNTGTSGQ